MFKKPMHDIISNIIESNLDYLVRFAYFRLGNRVEAEDLVHDAILKLLEKNSNDIKPDSVRLYLFKIVYNLCLDRIRIGTRVLSLNDDIDLEDRADDFLDIQEAERIKACLDNLHRNESEIIRMRVVDNLSFVEISNILSTPQSTVKSRFKSGLDKLRRLFFNKKMS